MSDVEREFIRAEDIARILNLSTRTILTMTARGTLPGFRLPYSRIWLYRPEKIRAVINEAERVHELWSRSARKLRVPTDYLSFAAKPAAKAGPSHLERIMAKRRPSGETKSAGEAPAKVQSHWERIMAKRRRRRGGDAAKQH